MMHNTYGTIAINTDEHFSVNIFHVLDKESQQHLDVTKVALATSEL